MSYTLNSTNRDQTLTVGSKFSIAVTGDFRGGRLKLLVSTDGGLTYAPRDSRGEDIFIAPDVRTFDWPGDIKLVWEGSQGEVVVEVAEAGAILEAIETGIEAGNVHLEALETSVGGIDTMMQAVEENGRLQVETLGLPSVRQVVAAGAASANVALTSTCRRASIVAIGADIRFAVGSTNAIAATATTHLILQNERLDIHLPTTPHIAAIRNAATSGTLEISELLP